MIAELFRCRRYQPERTDHPGGQTDPQMMSLEWEAMSLAFQEEAGSVKDVELTEADIDSFIRAKGAIFSAIRTMLSYL